MDQKINIFLEWLSKNGAIFPKVDWPRNDTNSGIRGAIAIEDIVTNEEILEIPFPLMISPIHAFQDEFIGQALKESLNILQGDFLLTIYLMSEINKNNLSFYYPYLNIIPHTPCLSEWSDSELLELQDNKLYLLAIKRRKFLKDSYKKILNILSERYPKLFSFQDYPFTNFKFCWNAIQARAFGRRLPWTALVPFADCLNHSNIQTKYHFDLQHEKKFTLFPTGNNKYLKGEEIFNSYGRRSNENLLMDYGFTLVNNIWDEIEITFELISESDEAYELKNKILSSWGYNQHQTFIINNFSYPNELFLLSRLKASTLNELTMILNELNVDLLDTSALNSYFELRKVYSTFNTVISCQNEFNSIQTLINFTKSILNNYETTLDYDINLFQSIENSSDINFDEMNIYQCRDISGENLNILRSNIHRNALTFRISKKKNLIFFIEKLQKIIPLIDIYKPLNVIEEDIFIKDFSDTLRLNELPEKEIRKFLEYINLLKNKKFPNGKY